MPNLTETFFLGPSGASALLEEQSLTFLFHQCSATTELCILHQSHVHGHASVVEVCLHAYSRFELQDLLATITSRLCATRRDFSFAGMLDGGWSLPLPSLHFGCSHWRGPSTSVRAGADLFHTPEGGFSLQLGRQSKAGVHVVDMKWRHEEA